MDGQAMEARLFEQRDAVRDPFAEIARRRSAR
jgi:hypothetical protein